MANGSTTCHWRAAPSSSCFRRWLRWRLRITRFARDAAYRAWV